jgi:hypothetical protein
VAVWKYGIPTLESPRLSTGSISKKGYSKKELQKKVRYEIQNSERGKKVINCAETETISRKLQQGMADWNPNPLVPKAFQPPVQSEALNDAIAGIAALARAPLEETLQCQQDQIQQLQALVQRLEQAIRK